jgi:hypothetical protein
MKRDESRSPYSIQLSLAFCHLSPQWVFRFYEGALALSESELVVKTAFGSF